MSIVEPSLRRRAALGLVLAVCLPVLSFRLIRVRFTTSGSDPSFYLGHLVDLAGQVARFGQTYHGNRISYVLVDRWFVSTFGLEPGLLVARHVVLGLAVLAAFSLGARWGGDAAGVVVAGVVALTPWLPRQLLWTHYDGFAATYVLIAVALVMVPRGPRTRPVGELLAGVALAAAINANLAVSVLAAVTVVGWWALRRSEGRRALAVGTARIVAGWAMATVAVALTLRSLFPGGEAIPELVALRVGVEVLGMTNYFVPLRDLGWNLAHLVPVVAAAASLVVILVTSRSTVPSAAPAPDRDPVAASAAAAVHVLGVLAVALALHFLTSDTWFNASYYTIYHLPGAVVGVAAVLGVVASRTTDGRTPARSMAVLVPLAAWYAALPVDAAVGRALAVAALVAGLLLALLLAVRRRVAPTIAAGLAVATFLGASASTWHSGSAGGWGTLEIRNAAELDVLRHSADLKRFVEAEVGVEERLQFWHTTSGRDGDLLTRLNMVFYGTGEGRVHDKRGPGMPTLSDAEAGWLREDRPVVVLMATDPAEVTAGLVALQVSGLVPVTRADAFLDGDVVDVWVRIVALG